MTHTIFYRHGEDALSHAFLSTLYKLSSQSRISFLRECGLDRLTKFGKLQDVRSQRKLEDGSRPDGILVFTKGVVGFENKVATPHYRIQLSNYYQEIPKGFPDIELRICIGASRNTQTIRDIELEIEKGKIPSDIVDIFFWEDIHTACYNWLTRKDETVSEVDRFLIDELQTLLEAMELFEVTFESINVKEFEAFTKCWVQLNYLEGQLEKLVPIEFRMLDSYRQGDRYSSMFRLKLGFHFKNAFGSSKGVKWTYLFFSIDFENDWLEIGIRSDRKSDRNHIRNRLNINRFIKTLDKLEEYCITFGRDLEEVLEQQHLANLSKDSDTLDKIFEKSMKISRQISFKELEEDFRMNTPEFPHELVKEINRLRPILEMFDNALSRKRSTK